jgi:hypothetical protein
MTRYLIAALAALALAGCASSTSHPAAAHTSAVSAPNPAAAPSSAAPSPAPSPASTARLTKHQAARAYTAIVDPSNRALDVVNEDYTDRVPLAQFHQDERAYLATLRAIGPRLTAVRWPRRVEPYVRAMVSTDVQADIHCAQDELRAGGYNRAQQVSLTNQACTAAVNATSNPGTIRTMLGLPPLG